MTPAPVLAIVLALSGWQDSRPTVERLIALSRERSTRRRAEIEAQVSSTLEGLRPDGRDSAIQKAADSLVALGEGAVPFLVPRLEPRGGAEGAAVRSRAAARAIARIGASDSLPELERTLREGSPPARENAAFVLGRVGAASSVPPLLEAFLATERPVRLAAAEALGQLRATAAAGPLGRALAEADADLQPVLLRALASIGSPEAAPAVAQFLESPAAAPVLAEVLDYLVAVGARSALPALVRRLRSGLLTTGQCIRVVRALGALATPSDREALACLREQLDETRVESLEIRSEAAYALHGLGEDAGIRALLRQHGLWISQNPKLPQAWAGRAGILLRVGKHKEALSDFEEAIRLSRREGQDPEWFVDAGRCLARLGRLREAAAYLDRSGLGASGLARYRDLPEFEELRRHERYRLVFERDDR